MQDGNGSNKNYNYYLFFSVLNILIGVLLDAMQMPIWVVYVVVAYAVYQFLIEFFLEIYDCVSRRKSKYNYKVFLDFLYSKCKCFGI